MAARAHRTILTTTLAGIASCAAPNLSRTVGKGNSELHVQAGGPLFANLGPTIPVPHSYVGGRYGVTNWMDVDANVNLTPFAFGIWMSDIAGNFQLYRKPRGLAVASSARLYFIGDLDDPPDLQAYPEIGLHLGGPVPMVRWIRHYGGVTSAFQLAPPEGKSPVFLTPFFGVEFLIPARFAPKRGHRRRQHGIALHWSWLNPWDTEPSVVAYQPTPGAMGVFVGYRLRFGGLDR
jgi:hypothetical protein